MSKRLIIDIDDIDLSNRYHRYFWSKNVDIVSISKRQYWPSTTFVSTSMFCSHSVVCKFVIFLFMCI